MLSTMFGMQRMMIEIVAVRSLESSCLARARVLAPYAGARMWIELRFAPRQPDVWSEAYDRVLGLLDPA